MKTLLFFGLVEESTEIHGLVERLLKAKNVCQDLRTVQQQDLVEKNPQFEDQFPELFNRQKKKEDFSKVLVEWADVKFFKH